MEGCSWPILVIYVLFLFLEIPSETNVPITDASNAVIGNQKMTYLEETDDSRTVVIRSPAEDGLEETTLILNTLIPDFFQIQKKVKSSWGRGQENQGLFPFFSLGLFPYFYAFKV